MKRLWIGVAVLTVLLAAGIGLSLGMAVLHNDLSSELSAAAEAARQGDTERALEIGEAAREQWHRWRRFSASLADHEPLEEMDAMFAELELYRDLDLMADYAAVCVRLSELSRAISESHTLTWWNFL